MSSIFITFALYTVSHTTCILSRYVTLLTFRAQVHNAAPAQHINLIQTLLLLLLSKGWFERPKYLPRDEVLGCWAWYVLRRRRAAGLRRNDLWQSGVVHCGKLHLQRQSTWSSRLVVVVTSYNVYHAAAGLTRNYTTEPQVTLHAVYAKYYLTYTINPLIVNLFVCSASY